MDILILLLFITCLWMIMQCYWDGYNMEVEWLSHVFWMMLACYSDDYAMFSRWSWHVLRMIKYNNFQVRFYIFMIFVVIIHCICIYYILSVFALRSFSLIPTLLLSWPWPCVTNLDVWNKRFEWKLTPFVLRHGVVEKGGGAASPFFLCRSSSLFSIFINRF